MLTNWAALYRAESGQLDGIALRAAWSSTILYDSGLTIDFRTGYPRRTEPYDMIRYDIRLVQVSNFGGTKLHEVTPLNSITPRAGSVPTVQRGTVRLGTELQCRNDAASCTGTEPFDTIRGDTRYLFLP